MPHNNGHQSKNGNNLENPNDHDVPDPSLPGALAQRAAQPPVDGFRKERVEIGIIPEEHIVTSQALSILAAEPDIFKRSDILVSVDVSTTIKEKDKFSREQGTPKINELCIPQVRNILTRLVCLTVPKKNESGEWEDREVHPPDWLIVQIIKDRFKEEIDVLEGIVESPVIRPDGSIILREGYDRQTGVFYKPNEICEPIPEIVTLETAQEARDELNEVVKQFPFKSRTHKAAWLSGLLTPFARYSINEPCPIFLFDANQAGTGKSLLCDLISIIFTGRPMARTTYPFSEEELGKIITSVAISADPMMLWDNISYPFGGANLDAVATSVIWKGRRLGHSQMIEAPMRTIWYATGNNVQYKGDIHRRVIPCSMDCSENDPYEKEFEIENLIRFVKKNRPKYMRCCLTILRGFFQAGKPRGTKYKMGTFEEWSDIVRNAVLWVTGEDCVETQREMRNRDSSLNVRTALISGLYEISGMRQEKGMQTKDILKVVTGSPDCSYTTLKEALSEIARSHTADQSGQDKLPSAYILGRKLSSMKNAVAGGKKLIGIHDKNTGVWSWRIIDISNSNELPLNEGADDGFDD